MQTLIRLMQQQDILAVTQIERQVQSHPWSEQQFRESVESYQCTVMQYKDEVIGFCILQPVLDEANLLLMAIQPKFQGQGLGYRLLDQSIQLLSNHPVQIFLEVRESNVSAIKLYEKTGFHQIDLRRHYYPQPDGSREHAVIMVKSCSDDFAALFK
ncbi:ribosomal protein S18-alanine N-acetyltransferase [Acinetobacter ihumii]|uniref:ribosomal protein S18-alanine N-acetyltransferase n=1 Tax=Acinetobacter ihumii TaxID=2483802 RepID=UPI00102F3E83|nr:ribosomal protein S18-alanine N-acetyltransferase [Acinetobacter ihumii]